MPGFLQNIAPYAAVLQGQQQGEAASAAYAQQLQQRQQEEQIKNLMLMSQLKQLGVQNAAIGKLPQNEQDMLNQGVPMADIVKLRTRNSTADAMADQIYNAAIDPKAPIEQRLKYMQMAAQLRQNPDMMSLPEFQKFGSGSEKPPAQPFKTFTADGTVKAFEGYNPDGTPKISPLGAAPATLKAATLANKPTTHWATESDDKGNRIIVKYLSDAAGNTISRSVEGRGVLAPQEKQLLESADSAQELMGNLRDDIKALKNPTAGQQMLEYGRYRAPGGMLGSGDPAWQKYFSDLGQLQSDLTRAATSGSSRSIQLINMLKPHIPDPMDPPDRALLKANAFETGRFKSLRDAILGPVDTGTVPMSSGGTSPDSALSGGSPIGWSPDGRRVYKRPDGSMYAE